MTRLTAWTLNRSWLPLEICSNPLPVSVALKRHWNNSRISSIQPLIKRGVDRLTGIWNLLRCCLRGAYLGEAGANHGSSPWSPLEDGITSLKTQSTGVLAHCGGHPIQRIYCQTTEYLARPNSFMKGIDHIFSFASLNGDSNSCNSDLSWSD
jgi:hypothetical protein